MKKEETHIIKEILNGKTEQYEYFLDRYGQQVFVLVDRIVSCQEDAEELTQDVFLKAFQQLSSFKAESSFSTWIYRIATNLAISAVRKKRNDVLRLDDSVFANLSDTQVDEALEDDSEEQMERLQQAMNQLEADERALITLYYLEEKPLAEVAFILGMTEGNAKVKLHRIRKKLYVLIKNYWCPLKVTSIIPMCPLCYQISILDTFSKSKPLNQKALVPVVPIHYF